MSLYRLVNVNPGLDEREAEFIQDNLFRLAPIFLLPRSCFLCHPADKRTKSELKIHFNLQNNLTLRGLPATSIILLQQRAFLPGNTHTEAVVSSLLVYFTYIICSNVGRFFFKQSPSFVYLLNALQGTKVLNCGEKTTTLFISVIFISS